MSDICHRHADAWFEKLALRNLKRDKLDGRKFTRGASVAVLMKPVVRTCSNFNPLFDTDKQIFGDSCMTDLKNHRQKQIVSD
jgi:hypothetical protein